MISIIDDDESVRESVTGLIRSLGYATETFESAEAFLKSDCVHETLCLISDVQMPGMSGVELQTCLIGSGRHIPTIFITAFPETRLHAQALAGGAIGILSKPFRDESLIHCIDAALAARTL